MSTVPETAKQIFLEAIEKIDPADWPVFIAGACRGNSELHQQLEELLKAHQQEDSLFDVPPTEDARRISEPLGESIGKYKLLQKIGEGGFGVVYMAEQTRPVRRNVALKIIKPGMDSKEVIARFEAERQALAMMDHPNIAKVLDGGETDSGHPYFVMELVKGIPLTKFCDENKLDTRSRLGLVQGRLQRHSARSSERSHPPRYQAIQRDGDTARRQACSQGDRLWRIEGNFTATHRQDAFHSVRPNGGHSAVYESRASRDERPRYRYPQRYLFAGRAALRIAHRHNTARSERDCDKPLTPNCSA